MSLEHLWQMSYDSKTIDILRDAKYAIPLIQSLHLIGITLLLGVTVILNLRLLGIGLKGLSLEVLFRQLWRWAIGGMILAMLSGFLVFLPDPARYAANSAFLTKMVLLSCAILFQFTIFRRVLVRESSILEPHHSMFVLRVLVPLLSLTLWFSVGWAGRLIAFLG